MKRTAINPWSWSQKFGFNQAELTEAGTRTLHCSGQCAMDQNGKPQHAGDMRAQVKLAFDNLETVLRDAEMTMANVVNLVTYTTDVDAYLGAYGIVALRLAEARVAPAQTMVGVTRLLLPELLFEVQATAVA